MLPVVIGTILFPKLSAMAGYDRKRAFAKNVAIIVAAIMGIVSLLSILFAGPAIRILFGKAFIPAVPAFIWLMPGIMALSVNVIFMNFFASTGMPWITVYSPAAAAILNLALNLKLIPYMGIKGASVSSTICYTLMLLASSSFLFRQASRHASEPSNL